MGAWYAGRERGLGVSCSTSFTLPVQSGHNIRYSWTIHGHLSVNSRSLLCSVWDRQKCSFSSLGESFYGGIRLDWIELIDYRSINIRLFDNSFCLLLCCFGASSALYYSVLDWFLLSIHVGLIIRNTSLNSNVTALWKTHIQFTYNLSDYLETDLNMIYDRSVDYGPHQSV